MVVESMNGYDHWKEHTAAMLMINCKETEDANIVVIEEEDTAAAITKGMGMFADEADVEVMVALMLEEESPLLFELARFRADSTVYWYGEGSMSGVELNGLELIGAMGFCIGSSNANATLGDYDWVGQSRSFVSVMVHNDDGSTDSEINLLPFEEGSVAVE
eukprot:11999401-Ditylum_brightwellii.AAC.1